MKNLLFLLLLVSNTIFGQGLIVNEISNGVAGNQEYYELIVIGSSSNPLGNVNLGGWIIDDNNGDFNGNIAGVGIEDGHIRITSGCLNSVKPGSIILIYNNEELSFINDVNDSNGDCIYIIPINSSCIEKSNNIPSIVNPSYSSAVYNLTSSWLNTIALANGGDAVQVRRPSGSFYHGFSYGTVDTIYPNFPMEFGGTLSFNIPFTGTGMVYFFNCGNFTQSINFTRASAITNETPGAPNNDANRYFINAVRTGTYDYTNLSNPTNCGTSSTLESCITILNNNLLYFNVYVNNGINLEWIPSNKDSVVNYTIQKSTNGYDFETINITTFNNYIDYSNDSIIYYRLIVKEYNGIYMSDIISVYNDESIMIYPNPSNGIVNINTKLNNVTVYNQLGIQINNYEINDNKLIFHNYNKGIYYIRLEINNNVIVKEIILQ